MENERSRLVIGGQAGPFLSDVEAAREFDKKHGREYLEMKIIKSKYSMTKPKLKALSKISLK